jgi:hypothetical protein
MHITMNIEWIIFVNLLKMINLIFGMAKDCFFITKF